MRRTLVTIAATVALSLVTLAPPAASQPVPNQHVQITFAGGYTGVAVATGVIDALAWPRSRARSTRTGAFSAH